MDCVMGLGESKCARVLPLLCDKKTMGPVVSCPMKSCSLYGLLICMP